MYEFVQTLVVTFLAAPDYSDTGAILSMIWSTLYDMRSRYEEVVTVPALRVCTGVGLMLGWGNPYAQLARQACLWQVLAVPTALDAADIFFVHYPVLHCMCAMPPGVALAQEAAAECWARAPVQYRPIIS
eukprot:2669438-Rhodomonas_salina.1